MWWTSNAQLEQYFDIQSEEGRQQTKTIVIQTGNGDWKDNYPAAKRVKVEIRPEIKIVKTAFNQGKAEEVKGKKGAQKGKGQTRKGAGGRGGKR